MKPIDVKDNTDIDFKKVVNDKDPKFKVVDHVRISKHKNIFAKGYTQNCSEEVFIVSKIKSAVLWTYVINDLSGEEIIITFYEKELQKTNQQEFRIEGYDNNSFNSWIDKKRFSMILSYVFKSTISSYVFKTPFHLIKNESIFS